MDSTPIHAHSGLNRPVLCPNHELLAVVDHTQVLAIFSLKLGCPILKVQFPKNVRACLSVLSILKWSPDSFIGNDSQQAQDDTLTTWLLLAGGSRLIAVEVKIPHRPTSNTPAISARADVLVDYQFEPQFGSINVADFVLNHDQALVLFDMNTHACLVSLTKPQRYDIPCPKFPNVQGLAQSHEQHHFALLLRVAARDQVAIFTSRDGTFGRPVIFLPDTLDAQSLEWSPDGNPILAVVDSPAYKARILFCTASGHALRSLDLYTTESPSNVLSQDMLGVGVTCYQWRISSAYGTMLAAGIGGPQLAICGYNVTSMNARHTAFIACNRMIDGNKCVAWQQQDDKSFERVSALFEVQVEFDSEIDMIAMNSPANIVAARVNTMPKSVWLWQTTNPDLQCLITFQTEIKQILWHPTVPNILGLMTNERQPAIYFSYNFEHEPAKVMLPFANIIPSSRWVISWVRNANTTRCPLLVSSGSQFGVGFLSLSGSSVVFESLLGHDTDEGTFEAEETEVIDTPSKPARYQALTLGSQINELSGNWAVPVTQYAW